MKYTNYTKKQLIEEVRVWKDNYKNLDNRLDIEYERYIRMIDKKDNLIKRMAKYIDDIESDGDICNTKRCSLDGYDYERDYETCINCIINYFENKEENE